MVDPKKIRLIGEETSALAKKMSKLLAAPVIVPALVRPDPPAATINFAHLNLETEAQANYASKFKQRLVEIIRSFESELDPTEEVGLRVVTFGQAVTIHLEDIGFYNPSLIVFRGRTEAGDPVELVQHVTQISVLLMRLPALDPAEPRRIGFDPPA